MNRFEDELQRALTVARVSPYHGRAILQLCAEERRRAFIAGLQAARERRPDRPGFRRPSAVQAGLMKKAERP